MEPPKEHEGPRGGPFAPFGPQVNSLGGRLVGYAWSSIWYMRRMDVGGYVCVLCTLYEREKSLPLFVTI